MTSGLLVAPTMMGNIGQCGRSDGERVDYLWQVEAGERKVCSTRKARKEASSAVSGCTQSGDVKGQDGQMRDGWMEDE